MTEESNLKHRDFIDAGFTCETDESQPTKIIYRYRKENTDLVFSFNLATDVCWLISDGSPASVDTYCHAEIDTIGQVKSLLDLYQNNLTRKADNRRNDLFEKWKSFDSDEKEKFFEFIKKGEK